MRIVIQFSLLLALACGCSTDDSLYKRFQARDESYFIQVATDCDSILQQHPIGSAGLQVSTNAPDWLVLTAESLPPTLNDLHPKTIILTTNRIWVGFGGGDQLDWGIMWCKLDQRFTNTWALRSCIAYSFERTLFVTNKP
jgi:hypothetical protein